MPVPTTTNVAEPKQFGFHARLGTSLLRLATSPDRQLLVQQQSRSRETINTSENPEDFSDEFGRTFSRTDFSGGGGLRYAHRAGGVDQDKQRFWDSYGVGVGPEGQVSLLPDTETVETLTPSAYPTRAAYDGNLLYWTYDSVDLRSADNPGAASPTLAGVVTGSATTLRDVATLGTGVFVANGTEVRWDQGTDTWVQWSDIDATRVWSVKNRIVVSTGASLYDDPAGAGPHTSKADLRGGAVWQDVADAGAFVLAAADDGYVYSFSFDGSALTLVAQTAFPQEIPCAVQSLQGVVAVTTYQENDDGTNTGRLWVGSVGGDGVLADMAVVKEWDSLPSTGLPCVLAAPERDAMYTAVSDGTDTEMWRYDVADAAVTRDLIFEGTPGFATTIIRAEGRTWLWTDGAVADRELGTLRTTGWLVTPAADFFTSEDKTWAAAALDGDFGSGGVLALQVSNLIDSLDNPADGAYWQQVRNYTSSSDDDAALSVASTRYLSVRVTFTGAATLRGVSLRALPPLSDEIIQMTVNVSDLIARPGRAPSNVRGYGDEVWSHVRGLMGKSVELEIFQLNKTWSGSLVEVTTPVPVLYPRGGVTRTMQATFRGREFTDLTTASNGGWGAAQWASGVWGDLGDET
jgi:hypothetical protein